MVAFGRFNTMATAREEALRNATSRIANMGSTVGDIGTQMGAGTGAMGAPRAIDPNEIPAVAGLANLQASVSNLSTTRESENKRQAGQLPKYVTAYRNYLKWRYPNVYGGGKSKGGLTPVSGSFVPGYDVPDLPPIANAPAYGQGF